MKNKRAFLGQSTIEFTFAMVIILVLIFGMIRIFRWAGMDLAERRWAHEDTLSANVGSPEEQLTDEFYRSKRMNAAYRGFEYRK